MRSGQTSHVIMNLCLNPADAIPERGNIEIATREVVLDSEALGVTPGEYVESTVRDDGEGIAPEILDRVLEPFFSTKSTAGLGLAVSWGIIQRHGGTLTVHENPAGGADFRVELPFSSGSDGPN